MWGGRSWPRLYGEADTSLLIGSGATMASERPPSNPLQRATAPIARAGVRGAQGLARRLGLDRAAERGVERALDSETAANATEKLLKSDTANRVWDKVLESDEAQKLVERVAEAPEVRAAITSQGIGLVEDLRRGVRRATRRVDTVLENGARRPPRSRPRARNRRPPVLPQGRAREPADLRGRLQPPARPRDRRGRGLR